MIKWSYTRLLNIDFIDQQIGLFTMDPIECINMDLCTYMCAVTWKIPQYFIAKKHRGLNVLLPFGSDAKVKYFLLNVLFKIFGYE